MIWLRIRVLPHTHDDARNVAAALIPAVTRKKITAAFDGGRITSDGGVMLLAGAERGLQLPDRLAAANPRSA